MSSKSKRKRTQNPVPTSPLPDVEKAQSELARRYFRAVISFLVRLVAVALLSALFLAQFPGVRPFRYGVDVVSGFLVLWPFFHSVNRIYTQRLVLGRRYAEAGAWKAVAGILSPVEGWRARLFDVSGEGLYWRAMALRATGQGAEAHRLFTQVVQNGGAWSAQAQAQLNIVEKQTSI